VARTNVDQLLGPLLLGNYYTLEEEPESLVPFCLDTLAWVQHLLRRDVDAANTMRQARASGGNAPEILWHAAVIYAAINNLAEAAAELSAAVKADPNLANRDDIQRLNQQLSTVVKLAPK
jgi:hypothetical protein